MECSVLWYLEKFNILKTLNEEEKKMMSSKMSESTFKKKQNLTFNDESGRYVYFLKEGKVKVFTTSADGREMILVILNPGEMFGELSVMDENDEEQTAEAIEDALICKLPVEEMKMFMEKNAKFSLAVTKLIGFRLRKITTRLEMLFFKSAPERVKCLLMELAKDHGKPIGDEMEIKLHLTHQDMANLCATTRQTVTTILRNLEEQDEIIYDRKRILIRNPATLCL